MITRSLLFVLTALLLTMRNTIAQSHYPGQHEDKIKLHDKLSPAVYAFNLGDVKLLKSRFTENMEREERWILKMPTNSLLHSFRTNAGVFNGLEGGYSSVKKLGGWESLDCELRGHTTGHILSGLALLYAATGEEKYKQKADSIVSGLAVVQKTLDQGGYLSAFPQELINRNIAGKKVWAPWYTQHKILSGLIDQYLYCDNKQALGIAQGMSAWAYQKLEGLTSEQRKIVLRNEFGGINDAFYNLYAITGDARNKWLGDFFYHNETLDPLKDGKDILDKKHANTYIPKLIGLSRESEIDGSGDGEKIAAFFWNTVVDHHTFATGSNSEKEHFFQPDALSKHLTGYTGESCNVYNMLKLTTHLYTHSMNTRYMDYYEKALINHILGQQDPKTGMISYFLPLKSGTHKVYSTPDSSFWCCVGSGFENQAKYGESIYFHTKSAVVVNLFIPSVLNWKERSFQLKQETAFPENGALLFTVTSPSSTVEEILIRYPSWASQAILKINGRRITAHKSDDGYIHLKRQWKTDDRITVDFPMHIYKVPANDSPDVFALAYGPTILAGQLGNLDFKGRQPYSDPTQYNDYYVYNYNIPKSVNSRLQLNNAELSKSIHQIKDKVLTFSSLKNNMILRPLFDTHRQRYVVYWNSN